jgi:hypothetical protein
MSVVWFELRPVQKHPAVFVGPARLGAAWTSQLDNHCCDLISRLAPTANHGIDF